MTDAMPACAGQNLVSSRIQPNRWTTRLMLMQIVSLPRVTASLFENFHILARLRCEVALHAPRG